MTSKLDEVLAARQSRAEQMKVLYADVYEELTGPEGTYEVTVGEMPIGKKFFTFQTTTEWIKDNVVLVGEMQMFNEEDGKYHKIGNDAGNIEITSENIDLIRQRPVDFSREVGIAKYLLMHPFHNLPDLVLVVSAPWVDNPKAPEWEDGRATLDSCDIEIISERTDKVLLHLGKKGQMSRYTVYALDGQHRLIGIKAAVEMLDRGVLSPRKKDGSVAGKNAQEHLQDWLEEVEDLGITMKDVLKFRTEKVGVKLVPAVCKGETWDEAVQRIASIFKAFNTTSVAVPKGATTAMDQEDGFAITARRAWKRSWFLCDLKGLRNPRISPTTNTIAAKSTVVTTLSTMKSMAEEYLDKSKYATWYRPIKKNTMGQPPSEELVEEAVVEFVELWDAIATLPSMRSIEPWETLPREVQVVTKKRSPRDVAEMRRFPTQDKPGEAHMLFRPLGQQALATAVGVLVNHPQQPMVLEEIFEILRRYDSQNGFSLIRKSNPWWGVLYDQTKEKIVTSGAKLAADILEYMLSGDTSRGVENLRLAFASARKSSTEGMYVDLNGEDVPLERLALPARLY
jgi:hypothetical protein